MKHGWLGIIVFFVVSGFAIQTSAQRTATAREYFAHRFWRIYPPYIASVALVVVFVVARKLLTGTNDLIALPSDLGGWLATATLTTSPVTSVKTINWVYWTLSYELAFYALIGLTVAWPAARWPVLVGTTAAACIVGHPPAAIFFLENWSFFALGAALASWQDRPSPLPWVVGVLALLDLAMHRQMSAMITAMLTLATCVACISPWGAFLNREMVLSRVGVWSYGLYLIHVPLGCWLLMGLAHGLRDASPAAHLITDGVMLACLVGFAALFYRFVERPSMRAGARKAPLSSSEVQAAP